MATRRTPRTSSHGVQIVGPSNRALVWALLIMVAWSPIVAAVMYIAGVGR